MQMSLRERNSMKRTEMVDLLGFKSYFANQSPTFTLSIECSGHITRHSIGGTSNIHLVIVTLD